MGMGETRDPGRRARDALGFRMKLGVLAPSTNTIVQPDFDDMRPRGVTNHMSRIHIPNQPLDGNDDFNRLMDNVRAELMNAVDRVATCEPDYLIMGMSAETFWDGLAGSQALERRICERAGVGVAMGSDACRAALERYGGIERIAVITPYMPVADANVERFFRECGFDVVALEGLKCPSPVAIAEVSKQRLTQALRAVDQPQVQAIVQVGTNLSMARLAGEAERWLDKPVIAINTAIYWWALRSNGIEDRIDGFGTLLAEF